MTYPSRGGYYVIVGGVLLHLTLGTMYMFGSIQPYVASYLRLYDPSITVEDTSMIFSVITLVVAICMPLVGLLQFRFGLRSCAAIGACLLGCSTMTCSGATTFGGITVLNAISGLGVAFAYTCPLVSGFAWMPDRKGLVSGFVAAGFGSGAAVFNVLATWLVNPGNASPDPKTGFFSEEIARRVPMMYMVLGMSDLLLGIVGSMLLSLPPPASSGTVGKYESLADVSTTTKEMGKSMEEGDNGSDKGDGNVAHEMEAGQHQQYECLELLKELDFYILSVTMALTAVSGLFIGGNYKRIAMQSFPDADRFLSVLGCAAYVCNGVGRIIFGLALDRLGCFPTLVMMSASSTVLLMALGLIPATSYLFFLAICLLLFLFGGNFVVYPALTANMFGITTAGPNYGLVFLVYGVTCFIVMLWLAELATSSEIFLSCGVLSCAGTLSAVSLWVRRYRRGLPM